jgi:hypothetical protein
MAASLDGHVGERENSHMVGKRRPMICANRRPQFHETIVEVQPNVCLLRPDFITLKCGASISMSDRRIMEAICMFF